MNSGKMFWGSFLVSLGLLILLFKYDFIYGNFDFVWNIWPLIFVFWGFALIFKQNIFKPLISSLLGIFIAILLFGIIINLFGSYKFDYDNQKDFSNSFSKELETDVKTVNLSLESGAGVFIIKDTTSNLIDAKSYGLFSDYEFNYNKDSSVVNLDVSMEGKNLNIIRGNIKNHLVMKLNTKPEWNFKFKVGASKNKFDLSPFKVNELIIETGATNSKIKLGDKSKETNVDIEMGASSLTLEIPSTVGCLINSNLSLVAKDFDGFNKHGKGVYQTSNFNLTDKKIYINVKGGVSSLKVYRY
ncbi:MAG: hypothetical protein N2321_11255 [Melioribacteraceae bacterium]|nr:hypothetical protein [Melioribacteraceae bacterium]